ncbi:hypothetical protein BGW39_000449 [Mortierella sp. 14UC]|nr:hypothetical protein BGW39_000449 [Mortierella sp. 14UC]
MQPCATTHGYTAGDISSAIETVGQVKTKFCTAPVVDAVPLEPSSPTAEVTSPTPSSYTTTSDTAAATVTATRDPSESPSVTPFANTNAPLAAPTLTDPGTTVVHVLAGNNDDRLYASSFKVVAGALIAGGSAFVLF